MKPNGFLSRYGRIWQPVTAGCCHCSHHPSIHAETNDARANKNTNLQKGKYSSNMSWSWWGWWRRSSGPTDGDFILLPKLFELSDRICRGPLAPIYSWMDQASELASQPARGTQWLCIMQQAGREEGKKTASKRIMDVRDIRHAWSWHVNRTKRKRIIRMKCQRH